MVGSFIFLPFSSLVKYIIKSLHYTKRNRWKGYLGQMDECSGGTTCVVRTDHGEDGSLAERR